MLSIYTTKPLPTVQQVFCLSLIQRKICIALDKHRSWYFVIELLNSWHKWCLKPHCTWRKRYQVISMKYASVSTDTIVEEWRVHYVKQLLSALAVKGSMEHTQWSKNSPSLQRLQIIVAIGIIDNPYNSPLKRI